MFLSYIHLQYELQSFCPCMSTLNVSNLQWFSVVWTLIYHALRHHMVKTGVDSRGAAEHNI